jgi:hypothetical protein
MSKIANAGLRWPTNSLLLPIHLEAGPLAKAAFTSVFHRPRALENSCLRAMRAAQDGGGERDRTDDLLLAKQALSQLSYTPASANHQLVPRKSVGGPGRIWTSDLTLIKRAL